MKKLSGLLIAVLAVVCVAGLAACDGGSKTSVPGAVQNLAATPGDGQVSLAWSAPANDGGAAIEKYEVTYGVLVSGAASITPSPETWVDSASAAGHTFADLTNGTEYVFKVRAVNAKGAGAERSANATPTAGTVTPVNAATPTITAEPQNATVLEGETATLSVTASVTDGGTLTYQWYLNTTNSATGGTAVNGATNNTYSPATSDAETYYYYVVITNTLTDNGDGGTKTATKTSAVAVLTVNEAAPPVNAATPTITAQPQNATVLEGETATLSVTASVTDGGTLTYQWYLNTTNSATGGTAVNGATNNTYSPATTDAETYYYYVVITNTLTDNGDGGTKTATKTSAVAVLTVNEQVAQTYTASVNPTSKIFTAAIVGYAVQTAQIFTVTNTGNQELTDFTATLGDADFEISTALSGTTLAVDSTVTVSVRPKTGLDVDAYTDTLTLRWTNDDGTGLSVNLSFTVRPVPTYTAEIDPQSKDFGSITAGYSTQEAQEFTITNTGNQRLTQIAATFENDVAFEIVVDLPGTIAVDGTATFSIRPKRDLDAQTYEDTLTILWANGDNAGLSVSLSFTVTPTPIYTAWVDSISKIFAGAELGYAEEQMAQAFSITNSGNQALTNLTAALTKGGDSVFEISAALSPDTVALGGTVTVSVRPALGAPVGTHTDTLVVRWDNDDGVGLTMSLSFSVSEGPSYLASVDSTDYAFDNVAFGYPYFSWHDFSITNAGNQELTGITAMLTHGDKTYFEIGSLSNDSMVPGGEVSITIRPVTGLSEGSYTDTLTLRWNNDDGIGLTIALSFSVLSYHDIIYTYNVEGGLLQDNPPSALPGETVYLYAYPQHGYVLDTLFIRDADNPEAELIEYSANGDNQYSFVMPDYAVSVTPVFAVAQGYTLTLPDGAVFISDRQQLRYENVWIHGLRDWENGGLRTVFFEGESVNLSFSFDESGYAVTSVRLSDDTTVAREGNNAWTFTMPAGNVTLTVVIETIPTYRILLDEQLQGILSYSAPWATVNEGTRITLQQDDIFFNLLAVYVNGDLVEYDGEGNYYWFEMPAEDAIITADMEAIPYETYFLLLEWIEKEGMLGLDAKFDPDNLTLDVGRDYGEGFDSLFERPVPIVKISETVYFLDMSTDDTPAGITITITSATTLAVQLLEGDNSTTTSYTYSEDLGYYLEDTQDVDYTLRLEIHLLANKDFLITEETGNGTVGYGDRNNRMRGFYTIDNGNLAFYRSGANETPSMVGTLQNGVITIDFSDELNATMLEVLGSFWMNGQSVSIDQLGEDGVVTFVLVTE